MPPSSHVAARIFHDLVNHELRVPPDIEAFDAHFDGDSEAAEEGLVLYHIVRWGGECRRTTYLMCSLRNEMKRRATSTLVFITDLSK
jgi:hypothetical protein